MKRCTRAGGAQKQGHFWILSGLEGIDGRIFYCHCSEYNRELSFTALFVNISLRFLRLIRTLYLDERKKNNAIATVSFGIFSFHYCSNRCFSSIHNVKDPILWNGFPV